MFTNYIVPIVAVIALGLSIYNTYLQRKEFRPNISVEFLYVDTEVTPDLDQYKINSYKIVTENLGKANVILSFAGFKWDKGEFATKYYTSSPLSGDWFECFPYNLVSGASFSIYFSQSDVEDELLKHGGLGLVEVRGFIRDGYGKYYTSSPLEISIKKNRRMIVP